MFKYILFLAILIGCAFSAQAQTPLLQALIDATPAGGTLSLQPDVVYACNCVISKAITIEGNGAKVVTSNSQPALWIVPNTDNVTVRNVDFSSTSFVYDIVRIGDTGPAQDTFEEVPTNIVFDHFSIHGASDQDSQRGISANGANVTLTNFRIYEIHYRGVDSQAICVWNGPGPFLITDGYAEAAGENILFGGSDPSVPNLVPSDIQIRRLHVFKPLSWKVDDPSYAGFHWTVKNLLELKNARNVVMDGNVFENCWADAQVGIPILFTVRNQDCTAPWSTVQGVTFTNNTVKNANGAINFLGVDNETTSATSATCQLRSNPKPGSVRGTDAVISNNLFVDIHSDFLTLNGFYNVEISRNTHVQQRNLTTLYGEQSWGFKYFANLTIDHDYGIFGDGGLIGASALDQWTPAYVFSGNVIASPYYLAAYPLDNTYLDSLSLPADFRSPYPGVGADIDALNAAQAGVVVVAPSPTPTPVPSPSPSPTPTPSPSPTPTPTPSPSPIPSPTPTPRCVKWNKWRCIRWM